ncbi:MAG: fused MFS/spermidine synthase [Candidatus Beckwithbacteria bacterium]
MLKRWFQNYFKPQTIKEYQSKHNGLIQVVLAFNRPRLIMGGMLQSGELMKKVWNKGLSQLAGKNKTVKQALILGLGCGDCAFEIQKFYPEAQMTGVEIDNQVIEAAQCYFNLATVKNLKIAIEDGAKYLSKLTKQKKGKKFDLIIVDAYLGEKIPKSMVGKSFFNNLVKILAHDGVVIFNRLFFKQHKKEAGLFIKQVENIFGKITLVRTASNLLVFGWY